MMRRDDIPFQNDRALPLLIMHECTYYTVFAVSCKGYSHQSLTPTDTPRWLLF